MATANEIRIPLLSRIICPHCWEQFAPEDTLWVAAHPELYGDPRIEDGLQRFLPTRFNEEGNAIDVRGMACQEIACPKCHLAVPRALLELPPIFISIAGAPACGKSYFLAAMTWTLRSLLPRRFQMTFTDADPRSNMILNKYEEEQFISDDPDKIVRLAKTDLTGDLYSSVNYGKQAVIYPRPFLFTVRPGRDHPSAKGATKLSRLVCLYDNAGESFQPGQDTMVSPVTRHLAKSQAVLFCFDPTQDPHFRDACRQHSEDHQIVDSPVTARQEIILHEIISRIRHHAGMSQNETTKRPLVIIVTKYDAWWPLYGHQRLPNPWRSTKQEELCALDIPSIDHVSNITRKLLADVSPELVAAAEGFSDQVFFLPVSATGIGPTLDPDDSKGEKRGFRPRDINPMWCGVPMLTILAALSGGLIPIWRGQSNLEESLEERVDD